MYEAKQWAQAERAKGNTVALDDQGKRGRLFSAPTLKDIEDYAKSRGLNLDLMEVTNSNLLTYFNC
jgi:hypothetical protein